ncbi:MAG: arylsulfatase, partial [Planctomycetes bacterium]|nr:arylsulfatase [Planctomycetota bacterium]
PESKIPTPNLDRLAKQGRRFTDAHSPSSDGRPTRYGLLTGRYPWRTKIQAINQRCWHPPVIERERLTVGEFLKRNGYDTACVGKWHLGAEWPTRDGKPPICIGRNRPPDGKTNVDFEKPIANGPTARGFGHYFGVIATHFPPYAFIENERTVGIPDRPKTGMPGCPGPMVERWSLEAILPKLAEKAVAYIDRKRQPFFLYAALTAPRDPIVPIAAFKGKSQAAAYGDFVCQLDDVIGRLMDALERNGLASNTLVIATSDNGSFGRDGTNMFGGYSSVRTYGHNPSGPWRGIKTDIWEGGHRVPFIARWPGRVPAGTTSDETICHVDLLATAAGILGVRLPDGAGEDSFDISPALRGEKLERPIRPATVHDTGGGVFAIRQGRWKLIPHLGSGGATSPRSRKPEPGGPEGQLYDLRDDPGETKNLWLEHPEVVKTLTALLEKIKRDGRSV